MDAAVELEGTVGEAFAVVSFGNAARVLDPTTPNPVVASFPEQMMFCAH